MRFSRLGRTARAAGSPLRWRHRLGLERVAQILPWIVFGLALEVLGRLSTTDRLDALGVLALSLGAVRAFRSVGWKELRASRPGESLVGWLKTWRIQVGADLRGTPPITTRIPWRPLTLPITLLALAVLFAGTSSLWPTAARAALREISGLLFLCLLTLLWSALFFGILFIWGLFLEVVDAALQVRSPVRAKRHRLVGRWGLTALALVAVATIALPVAWALTWMGAIFGLYVLVIVPLVHPLRLLWKQENGTGPPASIRWWIFNVGVAAGVLGLIVLLATASGGDRLAGAGSSETALTALFGRVFAWSAAILLPIPFAFELALLASARLRDPARKAPARVFVEARPGTDKRLARRALVRAGFRVVTSQRRRGPGDVHVILGAGHEANASGQDLWVWSSGWPRTVRPGEWDDPELHAALRRRASVQRRRLLIRRLGRLYKRVRVHRYSRGQGFWIIPHIWYISHVSRDTDEEGLLFIGPPYHRAIPREARHHLFRVLACLEIDALFLEDGVGYRRFTRVLRAIFEYHDLFGERRLEDERHFSGLPGVRVMIHEVFFEERLAESSYPEPDYEDLGRARILHVFRDRGEDEERAETPPITRVRPSAPRLSPLLFP